jgi:hypothetical protein
MSGKPSTPISSPKVAPPKVRPSTPPPLSSSGLLGSADRRDHRLSANFLKTPEQPDNGIPFSPSLKRTNSGNYKSPDYKLNHHNVNSPYTATNLLKTPRHTDYDSDDVKHYQRSKLQKTPQFFSSAKKLFQSDDTRDSPGPGPTNKEDLSEISLQLKSKLSSALGKLQRDQQNGQSNKISFTELSFDSATSPTKRVIQNDVTSNWSPSTSIQRANINLQTLQQSPLPKMHSNSNSPNMFQMSHFNHSASNSPLKTSPKFTNERPPLFINMPSPEEEPSAHHALLAALSRQRRKSRTSFSNTSKKRSSLIISDQPDFVSSFKPHPLPVASSTHSSQTQPHHPHSESLKLPPLNIALSSKDEELPFTTSKLKTVQNKNNEQDAVLSLMSLSSPQAIKYSHSRTHSRDNSQNTNSPNSSGTSLSILASPINSHQLPTQLPTQVPILPPISGLIKKRQKKVDNLFEIDNDATDIDDDSTDEE